MQSRNVTLLLATTLLTAASLAGCNKSKTLPDGTVVYDSPEAAQDAYLKEMKPIWDKYPEATSHSIVLDDGTLIEIPQNFTDRLTEQGKTHRAFKKYNKERFSKEEFAKINAACNREERRFAAIHSAYGLPLKPLSTLCFQAMEVSN